MIDGAGMEEGRIFLHIFFILNVGSPLPFFNLIDSGKFNLLIDFQFLLLVVGYCYYFLLLGNGAVVLVTLIHITNNKQTKYTTLTNITNTQILHSWLFHTRK